MKSSKKTYKIVIEYKNNPYKKEEVYSDGLSLREAYKDLLDLLNAKIEPEFCRNWGLASIHANKYNSDIDVSNTFSDGSRSFSTYDKIYVIKEE